MKSINDQLRNIIIELDIIINYEEDVCGYNYENLETYYDIKEMLKDKIT